MSLRVAISIVLLLPLLSLGQNIISTVAGNGNQGYSGDGGPSVSAELYGPNGVTFDKAGNLIIADFNNNVIRKVDSNGIISTIVGTGVAGYSGDGGLALNAQIYSPTDVAYDTAGNLYVSEQGNKIIRKINSSGIITTIAGTPGVQGYSGDGGAATLAKLGIPGAIVLDDSSNLFFTDMINHVIRKISATGIISTIAGTGTAGYSGDGGPATSAQLNYPYYGIALDKGHNIYFADAVNNVIRKIDIGGFISTIAGNGNQGFAGDGGSATNAVLNIPCGVAIDSAGNLFFSDGMNYRVRKVDIAGVISTISGNGIAGYSGDGGPALMAQLNKVTNLKLSIQGNLFLADVANNVIRKITNVGVMSTREDVKNSEAIKVLPNPANDCVEISSPKKLDELIIYNSIGQEVLKVRSNKEKENINIEHLEKGFYVLLVNNQRIKLIKT